MYDKNSDYALNKRSRGAIVCKSVTGRNIQITRRDFSSDAEFERWKAWSDKDYHATEKRDRRYNDRCTALNEAIDGTAPSAEDIVIAEAERLDRQRLSQIVRDSLTETQYRRLCLYYLERMSESEIAELEGVGQSRISRSLAAAKGKLKKIFSEFSENRG